MESEPSTENDNIISKNEDSPIYSPSEGIVIELGDIIQLIAPTNSDYDQNTYFVLYVSDTKIRLVDTSTFAMHVLYLDENAAITDESITQISILARNPEKGYARQNKLLPHTWVDIHIGGELPDIITGEITDLEEDMIEITTYPRVQVIYINFEYKGLPEHIPIEKIVIREKPLALKHTSTLAIDRENKIDELTQEEVEGEYSKPKEEHSGEEEDEENVIPTNEIIQNLNELVLEYDDILEEQLETFVQEVEVKESEKRYTLDAQLTDMSEKLLSGIPFKERTESKMEHIRFLLDRFKWLRENFSIFDENGNVVGHRMVGIMHKPIVDEIATLTKRIRWLMPVIKTKRKLFKKLDKSSINSTEEDLSREIEEYEQSVYPDAILRVGDTVITQDIDEIKTAGEGIIGDANRYNMIAKVTEESRRPFMNASTVSSQINNEIERLIVQNKEVDDTFEAIISNFENMYSSVMKSSSKGRTKGTENVDRQRMVIQRYSLGSFKNQPEIKNGMRVYTKQPITENDRITIKSFIKLPEPIIRFSKVSSPCTNILQRSEISQTGLYLYKLLKTNTKIQQHLIDDLDKEVEYTDNSKEGEDGRDHFFSNTVKEYILAKDVNIDNDTLRNMIYSIIPKTSHLIEYLEKYINDQMSLTEVIKLLDPFSIYDEDITWKHYEQIAKFSREYIKKHKVALSEKHQEFLKLKESADKDSESPSVFLDDKHKELIDETYQIIQSGEDKPKNSPKVSDSEILRKILEIDGGHLYSKLVHLSLLHLVTPERMADILKLSDKKKDIEKTDEDVALNTCSRRLLAKKYKSIDDLKKDDSKEAEDMNILWDKDLDTTPYSVLKKYEEKKEKMTPTEFMEFLVETLIQKHDVHVENASRVAEDLIRGKRIVREGEYAMVVIRPSLPNPDIVKDMTEKQLKEIEMEAEIKKKVYYYRRMKGNWVRDESIEEESFITDDVLLCNIEKTCSADIKHCYSEDEHRQQLMQVVREKMLKEFDTRWNLSVEETKKSLEKEIDILKHAVFTKRNLRTVQLYKPNWVAYNLGKYAQSSSSQNIQSPHIELRDAVMSYEDFPMRQRYIIQFVDKYTREALSDESPHWLYCVDTNTKLFPLSIYRLAKAFLHTDNYGYMLEKICAEVGEVVEENTVDKETGYVLRSNTYQHQEDFDENGRVIMTHQMMQEDQGEIQANKILGMNVNSVKVDEITQIITNIYGTMSSNLGIQINDDTLSPAVIRISYELINDTKVILTEKAYEKEMQKKEEKKLRLTYENYKNQNILCIVAAVLLMGIQTHIPSIQTTKTFPGCVRSFGGYPFGEGEDKSGLNYISCVMHQLKSTISPWNSIMKIKPDKIATGISIIIDRFLMKRSDIIGMISDKSAYLASIPDTDVIPEKISVATKWVSFLPPIVPINQPKSLHGVSVEFEKDLIDSINKAHRDQNDKIRNVRSKLSLHSISVYDMINEIISKKDLLQVTLATNTPYRENSCCNDGENGETALTYFAKENPNIASYLDKTDVMAKLLRTTTLLARPSILYHPERTGIRHVNEVPDKNNLFDNEKHIYEVFIHYCNFDNDLPIPDEFLTLCNSKPKTNYNRRDNIDEKISSLKSVGIRFTKENAIHLMDIVNRRNYLNLGEAKNLSPVSRFLDVLNGLELEDNMPIYKIDIQYKKIRGLLLDVTKEYTPTKPISERRTLLHNLHREIRIYNKSMYEDIVHFLNDHGNLRNTEYQSLAKSLFNISNWKSTESQQLDMNGFYNYMNFMKNIIRNIVTVYPKIIENYSILVPELKSNPVHLCRHWNLAPRHRLLLMEKLDKVKPQFAPFSSEPAMLRLFNKLTQRIKNLMLIIDNLPSTAYSQSMNEIALFDVKTETELMKYFVYCILVEYIQLSNDDEIVGFIKNETRRNRKEEIEKNQEVSNLIRAVYPNNSLNDAEYEEDMDMNLNLVNVDIMYGDAKKIKVTLAKLLVLYLNNIESDKNHANVFYEDVRRKTRNVKNKEKKGILERASKLTKEEMEIEMRNRQFKLGNWNVGLQKSLHKYDKEAFEREFMNEVMIKALSAEDEYHNYGETQIDTVDLGDLDKENYKNMTDEELNMEALDISGLGEDYMDGAYYDEDRDNDNDW